MADGKRYDQFDIRATEPENGALLLISDATIQDSGTAESGTSGSITDTDKNWTANQFVNTDNPLYVRITEGTGAGQLSAITANDVDTLTAIFVTPPDSTSVYEIVSYSTKKIEYEIIKNTVQAHAVGSQYTVQITDGSGNFVAATGFTFNTVSGLLQAIADLAIKDGADNTIFGVLKDEGYIELYKNTTGATGEANKIKIQYNSTDDLLEAVTSQGTYYLNIDRITSQRDVSIAEGSQLHGDDIAYNKDIGFYVTRGSAEDRSFLPFNDILTSSADELPDSVLEGYSINSWEFENLSTTYTVTVQVGTTSGTADVLASFVLAVGEKVKKKTLLKDYFANEQKLFITITTSETGNALRSTRVDTTR